MFAGLFILCCGIFNTSSSQLPERGWDWELPEETQLETSMYLTGVIGDCREVKDTFKRLWPSFQTGDLMFRVWLFWISLIPRELLLSAVIILVLSDQSKSGHSSLNNLYLWRFPLTNLGTYCSLYFNSYWATGLSAFWCTSVLPHQCWHQPCAVP